jgi:tetratricopeptide (TPR) repeat protein
MARRWKKEELTYLKRYAKSRTVKELAQRFRTREHIVEEKLEDLGLAAKDSVGPRRLANDPEVKLLEKGVRALHQEKWSEAEKTLQKVIDSTNVASIAQRARRYLAICRQRSGKGKRRKKADAFLEAVYERNRGNLEKAMDICTRGGRRGKDERFAYLAAAIESARGNVDEAAKLLATAIEMNPGNRVHAFHDPDFEVLRSHPEHAALFSTP